MDKQWKLVPVEADDNMEVAAENDYEATGATFPDWKSAYRAMLAAAPQPPSASDARELPSLPETAMLVHHEDVCGDQVGPPDSYYSADQMRAYARAALAASPGVDAAEQKPCATLHDDGYWTWKGTPPHASLFAGWRMDVYAAPAPAASADEWMAEAERLLDVAFDAADECGALAEVGSQSEKNEAAKSFEDTRAALLAHLKARP